MAFLPSDLIYQEPHHHHHHHHDEQVPNPHHFGAAAHFHSLKRSVSFSNTCEHEDVNNIFHGEDELSDDGYSQVGGGGIGEKKRRLNMEQVKALEKSFELGNKLEPERKLQLAKALGLQPRQIAIWFQNRRARWKTKQLEKDYDVLKKQFEAVKADNDVLHSQNKKLHAQLVALKSREPEGAPAQNNLKKEAEDSWSYGGNDRSSEFVDMSRTTSATKGMVSTHQFTEKHLFPSSLRPPSIPQFLQNATETDIMQCPKMDQMVQDDTLICNMLGGIEDRQGLWSWPEQQNHYH